MPEISIIMGVYNDSKYLNKSIDSILNQTFTDFEFIICDDCSKDDSYSIIKDYSLKDDRIIIIQNDINLGLAASLNKCIEISKGRYIARMDSDDISLPDRLKIEYDFLEQNPKYCIIGTGRYFIDDNGRWKESSFEKEISLLDVYHGKSFVHPTVMITRKALISVDGYTISDITRRTEDYDLWCKMYLKGYKGYVIKDLLFEYREDKNSLKKRKYKYRIDHSKLILYWGKQFKVSFFEKLFFLKPIAVGLIPNRILNILKRRK